MKYSAEDIRKIFDELDWESKDIIDFVPILRMEEGKISPRFTEKYRVDMKGISNPLRMQWLQTMLFLRLNKIVTTEFSSAYLGVIDALRDYLRDREDRFHITDWKIYIGFSEYLREVGERKRAYCFTRTVHLFHTYFIAKNLYEQNQWYFKDLDLPQYRYNELTRIRKLVFWGICGEENVQFIKAYIKSQLQYEDVNVCLIAARLGSLRRLSRLVAGCPLTEVRAEDFIKIFKKTDAFRWQKKFFNANVSIWSNFYIFLIQQGIIEKLPIMFSEYKKIDRYKANYIGLSDYVLRQLYGEIPHMPGNVGRVLLILIHTGMYLSQICDLKVDCLASLDGQYVLRYYHNELRREVFSPLPMELAHKIQSWQKNRLKEEKSAVYLFVTLKGRIYRPSCFHQELQTFIDQHHICMENGETYQFRVKEFRHAFAYRMLRNHVPVILIQRLMHHRTAEMSLLYKEQEEKDRKQRYLEFIDNRGNVSTILNKEERKIEDDLRWLRHMIRQALPNGYCSLPVSMGMCPHANACLTCSAFRTTKEFLPVLRYQLVKMERIQALFLRKKALPNEKFFEQIEVLKHIISRLEESANAIG